MIFLRIPTPTAAAAKCVSGCPGGHSECALIDGSDGPSLQKKKGGGPGPPLDLCDIFK